MASELAPELARARRTWRAADAAEMAGDEEDEGQQHPRGGGAEAGPRDGSPGLDRRSSCAARRHGAAAVAGSEANAIREGLRSTGVGTLEKETEAKKRKKKKQHEGQRQRIKGIFPQSLIHHPAPRMAAQMSEHH